ncbi:MAG TPA: AMP-binding protein [Caulobacteraceae bacterium]|jgi:acyl-coenzyme A synthetase/AMP-(fatty) acid ligase
MFVLQQIHAAAEATPGKLALVHNGAPVTYSAFWRWIVACRDSLAPLLPRSGVAALWVDNLLDAWVLALALKSLGLDTLSVRQPEEATGADAACLIAVVGQAAREAPPGLPHLTIAPPSRVPLDLARPLPPLPEAPARFGGQVSLTSGTTGRYKMVLRHYGQDPAALRERLAHYEDLGPEFRALNADTVMCVFDFGLWTAGGHSWPILIWSLQGAVVLGQTGPMHQALRWPGITHGLATPYILNRLMEAPEGGLPHLPGMQLIILSGAVSDGLARQVMARLTPRLLINLSSTEAGGWARSLVTRPEDLRWYRVDANRRVEVVDEADRPVPNGQLGRIRVSLRADNARGYVGDAATSAQMFRGDWFYPGDLGMLNADGRLAVMGRTTDVVSIAGEKYPAEPWERAIQDRLGCEGVCLVSGDWDGAGERLCVFIEARQPPAATEIAGALQDILAGFAEAQAYVVQALPRTPNGKVKRLELAQRLRDGVYKLGPGAR